jgi:uncharacterized protein with PIN domain
MRFVADHMLGSLARWLRFLGFDTAYPDVLPDREIANLARRGNRVLLTRDRELARKKDIAALLIESTDTDEQLVQVLTEFNLEIKNELSRCSLCNTELSSICKEDVKDKIPERVYEIQDKFWECTHCKKYYWRGTHYENIQRKLEKLKGEAR